MAAAAGSLCPYPEAAVIEEETLEEQVATQIRNLPALPARSRWLLLRPRRRDPRARDAPGRLAVVWIDAHGDLNTPETLAVRERVGDAAADGDRRGLGARRADVALVGARNLDPPESRTWS